jgi:hypothetical protein
MIKGIIRSLKEMIWSIVGSIKEFVSLLIVLYAFGYFIEPILTSSEIIVKILQNDDVYQIVIYAYLFSVFIIYSMLKKQITILYEWHTDNK